VQGLFLTKNQAAVSSNSTKRVLATDAKRARRGAWRCPATRQPDMERRSADTSRPQFFERSGGGAISTGARQSKIRTRRADALQPAFRAWGSMAALAYAAAFSGDDARRIGRAPCRCTAVIAE
jgi:hypothetical protein